jgi:hypothetical protein
MADPPTQKMAATFLLTPNPDRVILFLVMNIVTTETDLKTWIDGALGPDGSKELVEMLAEEIKCTEHPQWGTDWSEFLGEIDLWKLAEYLSVQDAVDALGEDAIAVVDGAGNVLGATYRDDYTERWYAATREDLDYMRACIEEYPKDAYSHWCAGTSATEHDSSEEAEAHLISLGIVQLPLDESLVAMERLIGQIDSNLNPKQRDGMLEATGNKATLLIYWDKSDPQNAGWAWRLKSEDDICSDSLDSTQELSELLCLSIDGLEIYRRADRIAIRDPDGGIWWPAEDTTDKAELFRAYRENKGQWYQ